MSPSAARAQDRRSGAGRGAIILGGAHGSLAIARSLGRRGIPVWMVTADNPLPTLSRYVVRRLTWPAADDHARVGFLAALAQANGLDGWVLFAGSDEDVRLVAQNHATLGAIFTLTTPPWETVRCAYDKRRMNARAAELGIAQPQTFYPRSREDLARLDLRFPVVLKPTVRDGRNAFVGAKAWRADDRQTLLARYAEAAALVGGDRVMLQDLIPGDGTAQFSYAAIWDRGAPVGSLVARRRRQYPVDFGYTSTLVETTERREVEDAATRFLHAIDYSGLVEVEFKYDARDGAYKILDVNARAWTWIALGAACGIDFPLWQWRLAHGERIAPQAAPPGLAWLYLPRDLVACLHDLRTGAFSPADYLRAVRGAAARAVFAWDDPWPAFLDLPLVAGRVAMRRLTRRDRDTTAVLPSPKLRC